MKNPRKKSIWKSLQVGLFALLNVFIGVFNLTRCTLKRCGSLERMRDPEVWMWRRHTRTWMPS